MLRTVLIVALLAAPAIARADTDYFEGSHERTAVKVRQHEERTAKEKALVYSLLGGAALGLGLGIYFHVDSHDAAKSVTQNESEPVGPWNDARQAAYERAERSGVKAIVGYSVGGALAIGAVVAAWLTRPGSHITEIKPGAEVTYVPGGAVVSRAWSF